MKVAKPIRWKGGMFLRPQHFQQYDCYLENRESSRMQAVESLHWGLLHLDVDEADVEKTLQETLRELEMGASRARQKRRRARRDELVELDLCLLGQRARTDDAEVETPFVEAIVHLGIELQIASSSTDMRGTRSRSGPFWKYGIAKRPSTQIGRAPSMARASTARS